MQTTRQRSIKTALLCMPFIVAIGMTCAFAQGSAGGSVGNDEKSLSGSREAPRAVEKPARRSKPEADEPRRASRQSGGGGGRGNFDGAWMLSAVGGNCGGSSSNAFIVSSGKILGKNVE